jgi:diguanylate cyclase (GGDEF)-like protein
MWRTGRRSAGPKSSLTPALSGTFFSGDPLRQSRDYVSWFEALCGLLIVLFAVIPPVAGAHQLMDAAIGTAFVVLGVGTSALLRFTGSPLVYDASLLIAALLLAGFTMLSVTPQRETLAALLLVSLGVLAGYRRSGIGLWLLLLWTLGWYAVAIEVNHRLPSDIYVDFAALITISLALIVSRLASEMRLLATHDPLTRTLNRAGLIMSAEPIAALAARAAKPMTVAVIDLDEFKEFNDRHGHLAGDDLLVDLTSVWRSVLRGGDLLARFGGDEFVLVLTDAIPAEAEALAERMRALNPSPWSIGISEWAPGEPLFDALKVADDRLYKEKRMRHQDG